MAQGAGVSGDSHSGSAPGADADYDCCSLKETTSRSSSVAVIVSQEAAEPLTALDLGLRLAEFLIWINQLIAEPLMISFFVIM